jgi:hypothetical protein
MENNKLHYPSDNSLGQLLSDVGFLGTSLFYIFHFVVLHSLYKKMKIYKSDLDSAMIKSAIYLVVYLLTINTLSGNIFITLGHWMPMIFPLLLVVHYNEKSPKIVQIKYLNESIVSRIKTQLMKYQTRTGNSKN